MSPQYSLVRRPSYRVEVVGVDVALRRVQRQGNRCQLTCSHAAPETMK